MAYAIMTVDPTPRVVLIASTPDEAVDLFSSAYHYHLSARECTTIRCACRGPRDASGSVPFTIFGQTYYAQNVL